MSAWIPGDKQTIKLKRGTVKLKAGKESEAKQSSSYYSTRVIHSYRREINTLKMLPFPNLLEVSYTPD
jgi:hypothetical protein